MAKPRSKNEDEHGLPNYRGDAVNGQESTAGARRHDAARLLTAYDESKRIWAEVVRLTMGGEADLRNIHSWNMEFVAGTPQAELYERIAEHIDAAIGFMEACGVDVRKLRATHVAEMYNSHEGLLTEFEAAMLRGSFDTSGHMIWIGERTRQLLGAHVQLFRHVLNPIGVKIGPTTTKEEIQELCRTLNPRKAKDKLILISRMGASKVREVLPGLMRAVAETGIPVIWVCDPMHGNTVSADGNGLKTRRLDDIKQEIDGFFWACRVTGSIPGGVHLELTGEDVTECLGGPQNITAADLPSQYLTGCDPRLNAWQSLEIALHVARALRDYRKQIRLPQAAAA